MSFRPKNFAVWVEIPVTDLDRSIEYYEAVLQTKLERMAGDAGPMADLKTEDESGVSGHLYPGKPAQDGVGPTIHLNSPGPLEDTRERVKQAGGEVVSDIITIPAGRFFYSRDIDGNSIGFFTYGNATS